MFDINKEQEAFERENGFHLQSIKDSVVNEMQNTIDTVIQSINLGYTNPLEAFAVFKKLEKLFTEAKKKVDELAIEEAEKYGVTQFEYSNQKFELRNSSRTYDYSNIKEWIDAKQKLKEVEEKYKQVANTNHIVIDQETGEILEKPVIKLSKQSLIVK